MSPSGRGKAVDEQLALIREYLKPNHLTMISDRGTFSVGHLLRLREAGGSYAICSAPWGEFRERFDAHRKTLIWKKASYLSIEQQRRRKMGIPDQEQHIQNRCRGNFRIRSL